LNILFLEHYKSVVLKIFSGRMTGTPRQTLETGEDIILFIISTKTPVILFYFLHPVLITPRADNGWHMNTFCKMQYGTY
jgi:hypothetical protein